MSAQRWFSPAENVLLTGAGFTKDFGGYLAGEMWSVIFNRTEIQEYPALRRKMLEDRELNFERIYSDVIRPDSSYADNERTALTKAVRAAYGQMDDNICEYKNKQKASALFQIFISRFDSFVSRANAKRFFFSLNQDLLVERCYVPIANASVIGTPGLPNWRNIFRTHDGDQRDVQLPDQSKVDVFKEEFWTKNSDRFVYMKLHGSYLWRSVNGTDRLVIGDAKSAMIRGEPLLHWYFSLFEEVLKEPNRNLIVIGYGFRDEHINQVIKEAIENSGLKLFVVSPRLPVDFRKMLLQEGVPLGKELWQGLGGYYSNRLTDFYISNQVELPPRGMDFFRRLGFPE